MQVDRFGRVTCSPRVTSRSRVRQSLSLGALSRRRTEREDENLAAPDPSGAVRNYTCFSFQKCYNFCILNIWLFYLFQNTVFLDSMTAFLFFLLICNATFLPVFIGFSFFTLNICAPFVFLTDPLLLFVNLIEICKC